MPRKRTKVTATLTVRDIRRISRMCGHPLDEKQAEKFINERYSAIEEQMIAGGWLWIENNF